MGDDELLTEVAKAESSPEAEEPSETTADVPSTGGRRRGRRKIMKKVQSRDDEGYLGTLLGGPLSLRVSCLTAGANTLCSHENGSCLGIIF